MKVDRSKLKKTPTEAVSMQNFCAFEVFEVVCVCVFPHCLHVLALLQPADCRTLIEKLKGCSDEQLLLELQQIKTWNIGKVYTRTCSVLVFNMHVQMSNDDLFLFSVSCIIGWTCWTVSMASSVMQGRQWRTCRGCWCATGQRMGS